jgi:hypothetical protein
MQLDTVRPLSAVVGYGGLGLAGDLGYEGKRVAVQDRPITSAISAGPRSVPSRWRLHKLPVPGRAERRRAG